LERKETPIVLCLSRSNVPNLENSTIEVAVKGAYAVVMEESPDLILIGSGSEVGLCVDAAKKLAADGIKVRVVSMPSQELFLEQTVEYQKSILPGNIPTLSVEVSAPHGWHRFSHAQISMPSYGMSGSGNDVFAKFGFTSDNVALKGKEVVEFYKKSDAGVPNLMDRPVFDIVANGH
jgi:transketolase